MPSHDRSIDMQPVRPFIRSPWGDRRELLPKQMTYVCSLDVAFFLHGRYLTIARSVRRNDGSGRNVGGTYHVLGDTIPDADATAGREYGVIEESSPTAAKRVVKASPVDANVGCTYHVFGDTSFETATGLVQEVPLLQVVAGQGQLRPDLGDEALSIEGRLTLCPQPKTFVLLDFEGVVTPVGGVRSLTRHAGALPARTFVSTRHQCDVPSLRWLTRCQLFGVGMTRFEGPHDADVDPPTDVPDCEPKTSDAARTQPAPGIGGDLRYVRVSLDLLSAA
jgi:hypothetical protein